MHIYLSNIVVWKDGQISILHILHNSLDYYLKNCQTWFQGAHIHAQEEGHNHRLQAREGTLCSKHWHYVANEGSKQSKRKPRWFFWFLISN